MLKRCFVGVTSALCLCATLQAVDFDPAQDELVKQVFSSSAFTSQVFHYHLDGKEYQVRILHNPENLPLKESHDFRLEFGGRMRTFTITWNHKYGIIVDKHAPQELIDHLSKLTNASWWDWYFNFRVENGTSVKYSEEEYIGPNHTWVRTWTLDTWFNFTRELKH